MPPRPMWIDDGAFSQGKAITAILQGRIDDALEIIRQWSTADLAILEEAAGKLAMMAYREKRRRNV